MQRGALRITTAEGPPVVKADVPLGLFTAGDYVTYDGTKFKGTPVPTAPAAFEADQRVISSRLPTIANALMTSGTAYFVYYGLTAREITARFIEFYVSPGGAGGQVAEVGLFSSPTAPQKAGLDMTPLVVTDTLDTLIGSTICNNTADFDTVIPAGTHVWGGLRVAMVTTQPSVAGLTLDFVGGRILRIIGSGPLTDPGPFTANLIPNAIIWAAPDLRFICD